MSTVPQTTGWQAGFLDLLPTIQNHAQIRFRHVGESHREEAIQEAIAAACMNYQVAAAQGRLHVVHPGSLAAFAMRHVRQGRRVGGRQDAAKDVLSPVAQRRHGVRVGAYPAIRSPEHTDGWQHIAVADRRVPIRDVAAFRIDFARWLKTLARRDRQVIAAFVRGDCTATVAARFGISPGRVSQLRRRYQRAWGALQGNMPEPAPLAA